MDKTEDGYHNVGPDWNGDGNNSDRGATISCCCIRDQYWGEFGFELSVVGDGLIRGGGGGAAGTAGVVEKETVGNVNLAHL